MIISTSFSATLLGITIITRREQNVRRIPIEVEIKKSTKSISGMALLE